MKKLILASVLTLGLSTVANAGGLGGLLKDAGDFFSGKNQYHNISENDLLNTQWDKFKETDSESIYVRKTDKDNGFQDGVWLKHVQKDGGSDEYKHYQTDCNSEGDVLRNAKVTVSKMDGTFDRKKKDKIIKGDLKQDVRKLVCSAPSGSAAPVATASTAGATGLVFGTVPDSVFGKDSWAQCVGKDFWNLKELYKYNVFYLKGDKQKKRIVGEAARCSCKNIQDFSWNNCQDAFNINGKIVYLKQVNDDLFDKIFYYNGYTIRLTQKEGVNRSKKLRKDQYIGINNYDLKVEKDSNVKVHKLVGEKLLENWE